jgi:H+/Cl- antiporter ClcA
MTKFVTTYKNRIFHQLLVYEKESSLPFGTSFAFLFGCNFLFGFLAWLSVFAEPLAAGSGIPEIKCYLNGLDIPNLVSFRTLVCKAIGIVFACSAGLPVGKEGPMVHIGAVVAAGISQGEGFTCGFDTTFSRFQDLRNDREKRDFVACGAAAGVAAAFGAPIGGVLFSLEEGASFWSTKLTWRCFFCAMATVFFLYVFDTAHSLFGHSDITAMFSFGEFFSLQGEETNYSMWELFLFLFVGCFGGFVGACFNTVVAQIHQWRSRYVVTMRQRLIEVMGIVCLMTLTSTLLPLFWRKCTPLPVDMEGWSDQEKNLVEDLIPLYCDAETEYNELASLYLADSDTAIRQLFHFREIGDHNVSTFSSAALFLFFVPYLTMACLTYGTAVPAGMFVPSLLSGAALGRLLGHLLHKLDNAHGTFADSGTYALMGAASVTSGIARMTISLTVMILEATGDMQYVLPLMLTVLSARLVGNFFTEGIYDSHIHYKQLPFLDEDDNMPIVMASQELHEISVAEIMTKRVVTVYPMMTVGAVWDMLQARAKHHCFPVVDDADDDVLLGTITRKVLCSLLLHKTFHRLSEDTGETFASASTSMAAESTTAAASTVSPLLNWGAIEHVYPRYPEVEDLQVSEEERGMWVHLAPYMDTAPYIIHENTSIQRTYRMFRTLGLRHLVVTDRHHHVVGIVTRSNLMVTRQDLDSHRSLQYQHEQKPNKRSNRGTDSGSSFQENSAHSENFIESLKLNVDSVDGEMYFEGPTLMN